MILGGERRFGRVLTSYSKPQLKRPSAAHAFAPPTDPAFSGGVSSSPPLREQELTESGRRSSGGRNAASAELQPASEKVEVPLCNQGCKQCFVTVLQRG